MTGDTQSRTNTDRVFEYLTVSMVKNSS